MYLAAVRQAATSFLCPPRPVVPSKSRSIGRNKYSMYTVCGQAHPHQTRPNNAVKRNTLSNSPTIKMASSTVSVGKKVNVKIVNCRLTMSSRMIGLPAILMNGSNVKSRSTHRQRYACVAKACRCSASVLANGANRPPLEC